MRERGSRQFFLRRLAVLRRWTVAWLGAVALIVALFGIFPACAQTAASADSAASRTDKLDTKELRDLVGTLKDDKARTRFVDQLETLLKAREAVEGGKAGETDAATWLSTLSDHLRNAAGSVFAAGAFVNDLPKLLDTVATGIRDTETRTRWLGVVAKIVVILVAGYVAYFIVGFLIRKPRLAIEARPHISIWGRGLLSFLRAILDLLPLAAFGGAALAVASLAEPDQATRLAALALINAKLATGVISVAALFILAPYAHKLRFLPITDETAQYVSIWCGRIAYVAVYGYFLLAAMRALGLSAGIHAFLLNLLGLAVAILLIILILQNRDAVSQHIRTPGETAHPLAAFRRPLAATWHWLAIFYVSALYFVLAVHGNGGTIFILQGTVFTVVFAAIAWGLESAAQRAIRRALTIGDDLRRRYPGLQTRLNRYTAAVDYAVRIVIYFIAGVAVLEAWGFEAVAWIVSDRGERVLSSLANIVVVSALAVVVWEVATSLIERRLSANGEGYVPTTRARTLLPLAQTALKIVLVVLVTMVVLAEVGVNITPLLAGAGVVGLAVGFGAQKLVQDVITGWFILMEDTIAVGDVAEVAGHSGLVERINIRTIRLRDLEGTVHTIPFSAVDAVKNFTKDFSYYLFEVGVAYREDTDEVVAALLEVDAGMREDPAFQGDILAPLEVMGVDRFEDSAVIVRVRTKTRPLRQWAVGREFNRRMKKTFDAKGIEIPFPHQTVYFGVDKAGNAPPANLRIERALSEAFAERKEPAPVDVTGGPETTQGREATISDEDVSDPDAPR
jgi:moderate conductance mechanosensitive channel